MPAEWYKQPNHRSRSKIVTDPEIGHDLDYYLSVPGIRFCRYQVEWGEGEDYLHNQVFFYFDQPVSNKQVGDWLEGAHSESPKDPDNEQALAGYCMKEATRVDGPYEGGDPPRFLRKKDTSKNDYWKELMETEITEAEFAMKYPGVYCRNSTGIRRGIEMRDMQRSKNPRDVTVHIYWGDAGTGKSHKAHTENPDAYCVIWRGNDTWFDGYMGQKTLILDEFVPKDLDHMKQVLDKWQLREAVKGSHVYAQWTKVIIISNRDPTTWWEFKTPADKAAWERRITEVAHFAQIGPSNTAPEGARANTSEWED